MARAIRNASTVAVNADGRTGELQVYSADRPLQVSRTGSNLPDVPLPETCPTCAQLVRPEAAREHLYVCACGYHHEINPATWIALLSSPGSWQEHWSELRPTDRLQWTAPRPYRSMLEQAEACGLNEAVRTGACRIEHHCVWLAVFDFGFMGGTIGLVAGERLALAIEEATRLAMPFLLVCASGGARMQEGVPALMQMAKVNAALTRLADARVPYLTILTDPTFGGAAASLALLGDVNLAEPQARIGFTGPRVIRQATHATLPVGFQSAEFQLDHGQIDMIVPRGLLRGTIVRLLDFLSGERRGAFIK